MANENLQNALEQAGLTIEGFAQVIRVDPKSVGRWVNGNTVPYPRHRKAVSRALNIAEHELWPGEGTEPAADSEPAAGGTGPETGLDDGAGGAGDVNGAWAFADQDGAPDLVALISATGGPVEILDSCCGTRITRGLTDALTERAAAGHAVRVLTDGHGPYWEPLLDVDRVELLLCEIPGEYWMIKAGGRMLVTINLEREPATGPPPPLLKLTATTGGGGLFDRFADKFEELWALANDSVGREPQSPPARPSAPGAEQDPRGPRPAAGVRRWPHQPS